jgi:hypothetical protein
MLLGKRGKNQGKFEELQRKIAIGLKQLRRGESLEGGELIEKLRQTLNYSPL